MVGIISFQHRMGVIRRFGIGYLIILLEMTLAMVIEDFSGSGVRERKLIRGYLNNGAIGIMFRHLEGTNTHFLTLADSEYLR